MREAFSTARLLREPDEALSDVDKKEDLRGQALAVFKRWFNEQHYFQPLTQRPMLSIAREARALLLSFFVEKQIPRLPFDSLERSSS
jgi:hypothetical protein